MILPGYSLKWEAFLDMHLPQFMLQLVLSGSFAVQEKAYLFFVALS